MWIAVVVALAIWIVWSIVRHFRKPLPAFCTTCGCPVKKIWKTPGPNYDPKTGKGVERQRAWLVCSKWPDNRFQPGLRLHTHLETAEVRELQVQAECGS